MDGRNIWSRDGQSYFPYKAIDAYGGEYEVSEGISKRDAVIIAVLPAITNKLLTHKPQGIIQFIKHCLSCIGLWSGTIKYNTQIDLDEAMLIATDVASKFLWERKLFYKLDNKLHDRNKTGHEPSGSSTKDAVASANETMV